MAALTCFSNMRRHKVHINEPKENMMNKFMKKMYSNLYYLIINDYYGNMYSLYCRVRVEKLNKFTNVKLSISSIFDFVVRSNIV